MHCSRWFLGIFIFVALFSTLGITTHNDILSDCGTPVTDFSLSGCQRISPCVQFNLCDSLKKGPFGCSDYTLINRNDKLLLAKTTGWNPINVGRHKCYARKWIGGLSTPDFADINCNGNVKEKVCLGGTELGKRPCRGSKNVTWFCNKCKRTTAQVNIFVHKETLR